MTQWTEEAAIKVPAADLAPTEVQALVERIQNMLGEEALLIFTSEGVEIHPYS